jgi:hypothetical protein
MRAAYFAGLLFLAMPLVTADVAEPLLIRSPPSFWLIADGQCIKYTSRSTEDEWIPPDVESWPIDASSVIRLGSDGYMRFCPYGEEGIVYVPGSPDLELAEGLRKRGDSFPIDPRIRTIMTSSNFSETLQGRKIEYSGKRMLDRFITPEFHSVYWNADAIPWVEGVPGDGIGEWFRATSDYRLYGFAMLGGYIDFEKLDLYKKNGRPSRIRVSSVEGGGFSFEVAIDDFVHFERIWFPFPVKVFTVTLVGVYKGSRFEDTCVSAIAGFPLARDSYDDSSWIREILSYVE